MSMSNISGEDKLFVSEKARIGERYRSDKEPMIVDKGANYS